ncbi:FAD-dependent oxidoreductase [Mastigocoleus testarum]|uniref:Monooxygenase n=1 Tax=Mastigocoleus testarum BC008 TaxID=371196 RepID=A0A0V7ZEN2_9CYAN|nr:hypothetical protein [Mastigocoleus testarum]KST62945.1 monooxygenase [Mastigocoleus testarum BC008]KST63036.1 monooxygenase [Mastigocoleus testarum BC008]
MKENHAIVIGGSIAGMLAARVLADSFSSVTILETDKLPDKPDRRNGVTQSLQPHILFAKGFRILDTLFPGIGKDLADVGALPIDWPREFHLLMKNGEWGTTVDSPTDITSVTCSRPLLEWTIRRRLAKFSQIKFVEESRVTGLLANPCKTQICGVTVLQSVNGAKQEQRLMAKLVVDASGRHSQTPSWLESLGFNPPTETVINPFLGYATRRYKQPENFADDWKLILISHSPPNATRLGYLAKIENGEWIATLGGYGKDFPPADEPGFLDFARSLPSDKFYQAIAHAEPTSPIHGYRDTANRLRHYEKIKMPKGFVCLGDAVCALCPVHGQGMTVSALSALVLQKWLQNPKSNFQKSLAQSNSQHWNSATNKDLLFPTTVTTMGYGKQTKLPKVLKWYSDSLVKLAHSDPDILCLFVEVSQLLKSPFALYHPKIMWRVLSQGLV